MTNQDLLAKLCYYDPRNPDFTQDDDNDGKIIAAAKSKECYCDNCFSGKTELAEELLKTRAILQQAAKSYEANDTRETRFYSPENWWSEYLTEIYNKQTT